MKGSYWGIPIYFNPENNEVKGRNWFFDFLISIVVWVDALSLCILNAFGIEANFMLKIEKKEES